MSEPSDRLPFLDGRPQTQLVSHTCGFLATSRRPPRLLTVNLFPDSVCNDLKPAEIFRSGGWGRMNEYRVVLHRGTSILKAFQISHNRKSELVFTLLQRTCDMLVLTLVDMRSYSGIL